MKTAAVIGAGQLGSRHLQGLAGLARPVELYVMDVSPECLNLARSRYDETPANENIRSISFTTDIRDLPPRLDLAVIATNARERPEALESLLAVSSVSSMVLEKVAFQSVEAFDRAEARIEETGVEAWINCPRRMAAAYRNLKARLEGRPFEFTVSGGDWGLATSALHFIDLAAFFTDRLEYEVDSEGLDDRVHDSKRDGYIELTGTLAGRFSDGSRFSLTSQAGSESPLVIVISRPGERIEVDEAGGRVIIDSPGQGRVEVLDFELPWQSRLTTVFAREILSSGACALTPFRESKALHLPLLAAFNRHVEKVRGGECRVCPVT
ncbi:MAG: hypothetical protein KKB20_01300 [Proteobacteria bacterium]|nr:hypothetical protein [Pseudomonadota bacterium]